MRSPSPLAHLYRLAALLATVLIAFLIVIKLVTPASWNYEVWYRGDALVENAAKPLSYGGISDIAASKRNDSCRSCHEKEIKKFERLKHKALSCEGCHGALSDHAQDDKKVALAPIDKSPWQCLNCHDELVSRPKDFPQFTDEVKKHRTIEEGTVCLKCHDAHDPTP